MQKLIMFNGPPRAGKDTAGGITSRILGAGCELVKFTTPVKRETHRRFGINCATEAFEVLKDTPLPQFDGMTPRQAYTKVSKDMKAKHGPHCVAQLLADEVSGLNSEYILNTDVGFDFEGQALMGVVGVENTILVRIHRNGKNYDGDCREWVHLSGCRSFDIDNNSGQEDLEQALLPILDELVNSSMKISV